MADAPQRAYVSQFAGATFGVLVRRDGSPADADANDVTATLVNEALSTPVFTRTVAGGGVLHPETGAYAVTLTSADTTTVGPFRIDFTYAIDGTPQSYSVYLAVGAADPLYDALDPGFQDIIDAVYAKFADLFDSPMGGPHLQTYFQTRFGRGRMAQLLRSAVNRLNTIAQPHQTYAITGTPPFPFAQWGGLLEQALYVEVIKHLVRSYTEQPEVMLAGGISRLDRRDYMARWQSVLEMEQEDLERGLDNFKIANMGLGRPRVLVAGGVYGQMAPLPATGAWEGRPRFYPVTYGGY